MLLRLKHDPATWPSIDFHVGVKMLDADFIAKLESVINPFPKDFLAFLNGFLDDAFPE